MCIIGFQKCSSPTDVVIEPVNPVDFFVFIE